MKFSDTIAFKNSNIFEVDKTRNILDQYVLFKIVDKFKFQNLLEIGYYEGLTFSILYEASHANAMLTSCDITYEKDKLSKLTKFTKKINFITCQSKDLTLSGKYDFINIDGEHSYDAVKQEIQLISNHLDTNSIIMIDDYICYPGIAKAVEEFLLINNFDTLIKGPQQLFISNGIFDFSWLIAETKKICTWSEETLNDKKVLNYNYKDKIFINKLQQILKELEI